MTAISATDVSKSYGDVTALEGLSLEVETGETFGLLGTNGAGKSTLFRLLVGHLRPGAGHLEVAGRDVTQAGPGLRQLVGYLPEHAGFPGSLTGREVLDFHGRMRGLPADLREARVADVLETVGLTDAADRACGGYSNGMTRRLGLATALLPRPRLLLLDEPTAGLDPLGVSALHRVIEELGRDPDLTVVLTSHVLSEVEALCDRVAILHGGELHATGAVADLSGRGAATRVTIDVAPDDEPAAVEALAGDGGVLSADDDAVAGGEGTLKAVEDGRIVVECPPGSVPTVLGAVGERVAVEGVDVQEPGLGATFEALLGDEAEEVVA